MNKTDNYQKIIDCATDLIQARGYNDFSYRDIAEQIGIKTSSIHYHFPSKADLGQAIIQQHTQMLQQALETISKRKTTKIRTKIKLFLELIFETTYQSNHKMCLGGMLASDIASLPDEIRHEVKVFFTFLENWLMDLLQQGKTKQEFLRIKDINLEASNILATLEGALLLARLYQDDNRLAKAKEVILKRL